MSTYASYNKFDDVPNGWFTKTKRADGSDPYANERELFDLWITEAYNKFGVTLTYYAISFDTLHDPLFGEDNNRRIARKFDFMGFYSLPREEKLWSKFGIEGMDSISIFVSKRHFRVTSKHNFAKEEDVQYSEYIPKIGDIVCAQYNNYYYEITDVKEETGMYLLSKQHVWELVCKPFRNEHLSLSASTSADMGAISTIIQTEDPFNIKQFVEDNKEEVIYNPPPTEKPDDSFWN